MPSKNERFLIDDIAIENMATNLPGRLMDRLSPEASDSIAKSSSIRTVFWPSTNYSLNNLAVPGRVVSVKRIESGVIEKFLMMGAPLSSRKRKVLDSSNPDWDEICLSEVGVEWHCPKNGRSRLESIESLEDSVDFAEQLFGAKKILQRAV